MHVNNRTVNHYSRNVYTQLSCSSCWCNLSHWRRASCNWHLCGSACCEQDAWKPILVIRSSRCIICDSLVIMYMRGSFHLSTSATLPRNTLLADTRDCNCGHFCSTCSTGLFIRHFTWSFAFDSGVAFLKSLVPIRLWILYLCRRHHHLQEELEIYYYLNKRPIPHLLVLITWQSETFGNTAASSSIFILVLSIFSLFPHKSLNFLIHMGHVPHPNPVQPFAH